MKYMNKEVLGFLIVGGLNTGITYAIYYAMLQFVNFNIAYIISYVSGIIISFLLNGRYVFHTKLTLTKALKYPLVYIAQYIINVIVLNLLVKYGIVNETFAPIIVIVVSLPVTFILSKYILKN